MLSKIISSSLWRSLWTIYSRPFREREVKYYWFCFHSVNNNNIEFELSNNDNCSWEQGWKFYNFDRPNVIILDIVHKSDWEISINVHIYKKSSGIQKAHLDFKDQIWPLRSKVILWKSCMSFQETCMKKFGVISCIVLKYCCMVDEKKILYFQPLNFSGEKRAGACPCENGARERHYTSNKQYTASKPAILWRDQLWRRSFEHSGIIWQYSVFFTIRSKNIYGRHSN